MGTDVTGGPAISRRRWLAGAGAGLGLLATGSLRRRGLGAVPAAGAEVVGPVGGHPESGFDHVVVVMMENRSFDHFLGWLPGADGVQDTVTPRFPDQQGLLRANHHLTDPMGCGHPDPDHSYDGGRFQRHDGAMDNFGRGRNDDYAIGFYTEADRPFLAALARHYTTCDAYFCSFLGPTYPNRLFLHSAQTDRVRNTETTASMPTIWDQLNGVGGPTGRYYYSDVPFLGLWGAKYQGISWPYKEFLADAAAGSLPNVSFVDPGFIGETDGRSNDDHPHAHIGAGDAFLSEVFHALADGPAWGRTVFVVTYDEWGGFYDHVAPPRVTPGIPAGADPGSGPDQDLVDGRTLLGFRVPCIVASPFSRSADPGRPVIDHARHDHTSILRLIEWRFGLHPLTQRDGSDRADDPQTLLTTLRLDAPDPSVPAAIPRVDPPPPSATGCAGHTHPTTDGTADGDEHIWSVLADKARRDGWPVP
jgi:phospholipase C